MAVLNKWLQIIILFLTFKDSIYTNGVNVPARFVSPQT
jgi:hypothetical protein